MWSFFASERDASLWLWAPGSLQPPPAAVEAACVTIIVACPKNFSALLEFWAWRERSVAFTLWLPSFVHGLPRRVWCVVDVLQKLAVLATRDGRVIRRYLDDAFDHNPALRGDSGLLSAVLKGSLTSLLAGFSPAVLLEQRALLEQACIKGGACRFWASGPEERGFLETLPLSFSRDRDFLLKAGSKVGDDGRSFQTLSEELRGDKEIVMAFILGSRSGGRCLRHASVALRGDREVVAAAIRWCGEMLEEASEELKSDRALVKRVAEAQGGSFFASELGRRVVDCEAVVLAAAVRHLDVLPLASVRLRSSAHFLFKVFTSEVMRKAVLETSGSGDPEENLLRARRAWSAVDDVLKQDDVFLLKLLRRQAGLLRLFTETQRGDRRLVGAAVWQVPELSRFAAPAVWAGSWGSVKSFVAKMLHRDRGCWLSLPPTVKERLGLQKYECLVCFGLPKAGQQIRQCVQGGHLLCASCSGAVLRSVAPRCPFCRESLVVGCEKPSQYGARCLFAERELEAAIAALAPQYRRRGGV